MRNSKVPDILRVMPMSMIYGDFLFLVNERVDSFENPLEVGCLAAELTLTSAFG